MEQKNLNPDSLEDKAGLKRGSARSILLDRSKNPTIETLYSIAAALNCTVNDLIANQPDTETEKSCIEDMNFKIHKNLFFDIAEEIFKYLEKKNFEATLDQTLFFIKESYKYSFLKKQKQIDKSFIEWVVDSQLP